MGWDFSHIFEKIFECNKAKISSTKRIFSAKNYKLVPMKCLLISIIIPAISFHGMAGSEEFGSMANYRVSLTERQLDHYYDESGMLFCNKAGDLNFAKKDYLAALGDYQAAISCIEDNQINDPSNLINGICGSLLCYELLDEKEAAAKEFSKLAYHVALMDDEIENIDWFRNSPIYPLYKENRRLQKEKMQTVALPEMSPEEFCEYQCNAYAIAAGYACSRVPHPAIQFLCVSCIFGLQSVCVRCCKGQGFWENCVRGIRRLFHDPDHPENPAPHPYE